MPENTSRSLFPPLLQRLKNYVENGIPLPEEDYEKAMQPGCLVYAAMTAGGLARFRGKRIKGNSSYPLTHDAMAYQRAHDLTLRICHGLERRVGITLTVFDGR